MQGLCLASLLWESSNTKKPTGNPSECRDKGQLSGAPQVRVLIESVCVCVCLCVCLFVYLCVWLCVCVCTVRILTFHNQSIIVGRQIWNVGRLMKQEHISCLPLMSGAYGSTTLNTCDHNWSADQPHFNSRAGGRCCFLPVCRRQKCTNIFNESPLFSNGISVFNTPNNKCMNYYTEYIFEAFQCFKWKDPVGRSVK